MRLDDPAAVDGRAAGAKAANLARAAGAGLPVLPGFVLPTAIDPTAVEALRPWWDELAEGGTQALVVRSSSTVEDIGTSSMAGQFRSVLGVTTWPAFVDAVHEVVASAQRPGGGEAQPMAVLVQPQLDVDVGGVLFGVHPVTGDPTRIVVECVRGGPERLVSGHVVASRYVLRRSGRVVSVAEAPTGGRLDRARCRQLARLSARAEGAFGGPQDVEWAFDRRGRLWLLQSRPVTAVGRTIQAEGPVLGPGPVAETFPAPLRPLEIDLWVDPLAEGVAVALRTARAVSARRLDASPVVTTIGGWVAADLELFGYHRPGGGRWRLLDPRRMLRRFGSAWRLGRLRASLPASTAALVAATDAWLTSLSRLADLDDLDLLDVVVRSRRTLVALHAHEVLAGTLLHAGRAPTAAGLALAALRVGRSAGLDDARLRYRHPEVLALTPPRLGTPAPLPSTPPPGPVSQARLADLSAREALRLRARWVQELSARAVTRLAVRLEQRNLLPPASWAHLSLDELHRLLEGAAPPDDLVDRVGALPGPPLPAAFRLGPDGVPVAASGWGGPPEGGVGAGGGRGSGRVVHVGDVSAGAGGVLVTRTLDPALAVLLPGLAGLVAETGSTLSHLAILAREHGVPTVVAVPGALDRFPVGASLLVDGASGEVRLLEEVGT